MQSQLLLDIPCWQLPFWSIQTPICACSPSLESSWYNLLRSALSKLVCVQWFAAKKRTHIGLAPKTGELPLLTGAVATLWYGLFSWSLPQYLMQIHDGPRNWSPAGVGVFSEGCHTFPPPSVQSEWCIHFRDALPLCLTRSQCHLNRCGRFSQSIGAVQLWHDTDVSLVHFFKPIGITICLNRPKGVETTVRGMSDGSIGIWKKLFVMSMVFQILPLVQSFKMSSMCGSGWESAMVFLFNCW